MQQTVTLRYDLSPKGPVEYPPAGLDRKQALGWVTQNTNKTMGLSKEPDLSETPDLSDGEAVFLLYYLFKYGNARVRMTESHMVAPVGRPNGMKVPCAYVRLRYLPDRAAAAILKRTEVERLAPVTTAATAEAIEKVRAQFGIGSITAEGGAIWTESQLTSVRAAMTWLPDSHRVVLQGLALVRVRAATDPNEAGNFEWATDGTNRLEVNDKAFERERIRFDGDRSFVPAAFVGGAKRLAPQSLQALLHELAHAVEAYRLRVDATRLMSEVDGANERYRALHKESQELSKRWDEANKKKSPDASKLEADWKAKDQEAEQAKRVFQAAEAAYASRTARGSDRLNAFKRDVYDQEAAITTYATTSPKESFAEAYAAWRADPEFLQANAPKAFAWFEKLAAQAP